MPLYNKIERDGWIAPTPQKAYKVLFSEEEGYLRAGRFHRPSDFIRITRLDVRDLQKTNRQKFKISELVGCYSRTCYPTMQRRNPHLGQRSSSARKVQFREGGTINEDITYTLIESLRPKSEKSS